MRLRLVVSSGRVWPALLLAVSLASLGNSATAASSASYTGLKDDEFLKDWLVLKPIPISDDKKAEPDEKSQKDTFQQDALLTDGWEKNLRPEAGQKQRLGNQELEWQLLQSTTDRVDLATNDEAESFAIAYAWVEIEVPAKTKTLLGFGSTDAIRVWLNGKLLHEHWGARPVRADDDIVPVEFHSGKNQLLLKTLHKRGAWEFMCRPIGPQTRAQKLISSVWLREDTKAIEALLDKGLDINGRTKSGLTALGAARLRGDTEMMEFLASKGADTRVEIPAREKLAEALFERLVKPGDAGVAVLVAQNGKVLFKHGYGLADLDHHKFVAPETKFRIGSITKQFTSTAILKLQEEGKLSVNDKLSKYVPDFPRGDEVTLYHLLTHTSGIHSYTSKANFMETVTTPVKSEDLVNSIKEDPFDFDPGAKWLYNNSGFFLLGYIIEKVSGESYADFLRKRIFEPLEMKSTGVHRSDLHLDHEALGYQSEREGHFTRALNWDMSRAGGAGALYSTVEDLYRWNEAVFNGKVLKPESLKAAFTPVKPADSKDEHPDTGYGFGWSIDRFRGAREIAHGGGLQGFSSYILRLPEQKFTVVILANCMPEAPGVTPGPLARQLTEYFIGDKLEPRVTPKANQNVSSKTFDALVGRYDYGRAILTVKRDGDHLYAQLTDQPRYEIFPKSETEFFWKVVDAQVTFFKEADGKVTKAIHHQNGQTINAPRLADVTETSVDPSTYAALLGRYDYGGGGAVMTVTQEGDNLFAQLTGQQRFQIYPKSATEFFWKVVDAQVTFVKDANGKVTKAIHHQNGQTFDAPKLQ
jgi:CubicO group peptidase (beta-lactamase class C family)